MVSARGLLHAPGRSAIVERLRTRALHKTWLVVATIPLGAWGGIALAEDGVDRAAVKSEDGKFLDKEGSPPFKIASDGPVDWYPYPGSRRYHSECHVCHGPDGEG